MVTTYQLVRFGVAACLVCVIATQQAWSQSPAQGDPAKCWQWEGTGGLLASSDSAAFWNQGSDIYSLAFDGTADSPTRLFTLGTQGLVADLAVSSGYLYVSQGSTIYRRQISGHGSIETVATQLTYTRAIAVDPMGNVAWIRDTDEGNGLVQASGENGIRTLDTFKYSYAPSRGQILTDGEHLFWVRAGGMKREIIRRDSGDKVVSICSPNTNSVLCQPFFANMVQDGQYVYYQQALASPKQLRRVLKSGGNSVVLSEGYGITVNGLAVDSQFLYFVGSEPGPTATAKAYIGRLRKTGGPQSLLQTFTGVLRDLVLVKGHAVVTGDSFGSVPTVCSFALPK